MKNFILVTILAKRHANDLSGKIEEMAGDIQYLMQAFTGLEDRLSKIEGSGDYQGIDPKMWL